MSALGNGTTERASNRNNKRRSFQSLYSSEDLFPGRLHDMIDYAERHDLKSILCWSTDGSAFFVHDPDRLVDLLPLFFGQTKYRSFHRQMNMWSFERLLHGPNKNAFYHPYFIRGQKAICENMTKEAFKRRRIQPNNFLEKILQNFDTALLPGEQQQQQQRQHTQHHHHSHQEQAKDDKLTSSVDAALTTTSVTKLPSASMDPSRSSVDTNLFGASFMSLPSRGGSIIPPATKGDPNTEKANFNEGDVVQFEGRQFHFLDITSAMNPDNLGTRKDRGNNSNN